MKIDGKHIHDIDLIGDGQLLDDMLTADEVIKILRLEGRADPKDTLRKICRRLELPYMKLGRDRLFDPKDLKAWIGKQKERSSDGN